MNNKKNMLDEFKEDFLEYSEDDRRTFLRKAADEFLFKRMSSSSLVEQARSKAVKRILEILDNDPNLNLSQSTRLLETLSKISEADLNAIIQKKEVVPSSSSITQNNQNTLIISGSNKLENPINNLSLIEAVSVASDFINRNKKEKD